MGRQDRSPITKEQQDEFLDRLAEGMSVIDACNGSHARRRKLYRLRHNDTDFDQRWREAFAQGTDALEAEAQRRAVQGVDDVKVIGSGDMQREVAFKHYSDTLLIFLLKARDPARFRDNHKVEVTGKNDGPVQVEHRGVKLSDILSAARDVGLTD